MKKPFLKRGSERQKKKVYLQKGKPAPIQGGGRTPITARENPIAKEKIMEKRRWKEKSSNLEGRDPAMNLGRPLHRGKERT